MPSSKSFRRKSWRRFLAAAVEEGGAGFHPAGRFLIGLCEIRRPIKKPIENRLQDAILPHCHAAISAQRASTYGPSGITAMVAPEGSDAVSASIAACAVGKDLPQREA